jgi:hypothetical protein
MRKKSFTLHGEGAPKRADSFHRSQRRIGPQRRARGSVPFCQFFPIPKTIDWHLTDFDSQGFSPRTTDKKRALLVDVPPLGTRQRF